MACKTCGGNKAPANRYRRTASTQRQAKQAKTVAYSEFQRVSN